MDPGPAEEHVTSEVPYGQPRWSTPLLRIEAPLSPAGFGSDLVQRGMARQSGDGINVDWSKPG